MRGKKEEHKIKILQKNPKYFKSKKYKRKKQKKIKAAQVRAKHFD